MFALINLYWYMDRSRAASPRAPREGPGQGEEGSHQEAGNPCPATRQPMDEASSSASSPFMTRIVYKTPQQRQLGQNLVDILSEVRERKRRRLSRTLSLEQEMLAVEGPEGKDVLQALSLDSHPEFQW